MEAVLNLQRAPHILSAMGTILHLMFSTVVPEVEIRRISWSTYPALLSLKFWTAIAIWLKETSIQTVETAVIARKLKARRISATTDNFTITSQTLVSCKARELWLWLPGETCIGSAQLPVNVSGVRQLRRRQLLRQISPYVIIIIIIVVTYYRGHQLVVTACYCSELQSR